MSKKVKAKKKPRQWIVIKEPCCKPEYFQTNLCITSWGPRTWTSSDDWIRKQGQSHFSSPKICTSANYNRGTEFIEKEACLPLVTSPRHPLGFLPHVMSYGPSPEALSFWDFFFSQFWKIRAKLEPEKPPFKCSLSIFPVQGITRCIW